MMNPLSFGRLTDPSSAGVLNQSITVRRGHFSGRSTLGAARHKRLASHRRRIARLSWKSRDLGPIRRRGAATFAAGRGEGAVVVAGVRHRRYMWMWPGRCCLSGRRHGWKVPGLLYVSEARKQISTAALHYYPPLLSSGQSCRCTGRGRHAARFRRASSRGQE